MVTGGVVRYPEPPDTKVTYPLTIAPELGVAEITAALPAYCQVITPSEQVPEVQVGAVDPEVPEFRAV
jgi:hypothetical protein